MPMIEIVDKFRVSDGKIIKYRNLCPIMKNFVYSSLKNREQFYKYEFDLAKVRAWFKKNRLQFPQLLAVDMGSETRIIKDKREKNKMINIRPSHLQKKFVHYLPEDVYYDRNTYKDPELMMKTLDFEKVWQTDNLVGQELAFDIDPENIRCGCRKKTGICQVCMQKTVSSAIQLAELMKETFDRVGIVYSGRGMHVHVFDKAAFYLKIKERQELNLKAMKYHIDPWVSRGYIRLMRLPYSLNALVSRIVMPLTIKQAQAFDPWSSTKTMPRFFHSISRSSGSSSFS